MTCRLKTTTRYLLRSPYGNFVGRGAGGLGYSVGNLQSARLFTTDEAFRCRPGLKWELIPVGIFTREEAVRRHDAQKLKEELSA